MELLILVLTLAFIAAIYFSAKHNRITQKRARFIDSYEFPDKVKEGVLKAHPHLSRAQANRVTETLREYFHVCNEAGRSFISMPSDAVDTAWHEFILFTRQYADFCDKAFGRFLHHTPAEALAKPTQAQKGMRNAWRIACSRAHINPVSPAKLPMLFGIDAMYKIVDGHHYEIDCGHPLGGIANQKNNFCITHSLANRSTTGCGGCSSATSNSGDSGCGGGCGGCGS